MRVPPAIAAGMRVRAYVSTVFGCPYEGEVDPARTVWLTGELRAMGARLTAGGQTVIIEGPARLSGTGVRALDIRAGAAVVTDLPGRVVAYGVPARVTRERAPGEPYLQRR